LRHAFPLWGAAAPEVDPPQWANEDGLVRTADADRDEAPAVEEPQATDGALESEDDDFVPGPGMAADDIDRFLAATSHGSGLMPTINGKVGFVALLGRPNAGKSTLLNTLMGYQLAAVSTKPQTTRRRWLGIISDATSQILFLDIPGLIPLETALGKAMSDSVGEAVGDADVVVVLADPTRRMAGEDEAVASRAAESRKPVILAINKIDATSPAETEAVEQFYRVRLGPSVIAVHKVSGMLPYTLPPLMDEIRNALPEGPFLYPPDQITDARERDVAAELIRQCLLEKLDKEVPHAVAVVIEEFKEREQAVFIKATLHVEKETQRPIILGKDGSTIEVIRLTAEKLLSFHFTKPTKVSFDLVITKDWRKDARLVAEFLGQDYVPPLIQPGKKKKKKKR
jgi:GTP-binding protein Era